MPYTYRNPRNGDTYADDAARADLTTNGWTLISDTADAAAAAAVAALTARRAGDAYLAQLVAAADAARAAAGAAPAGSSLAVIRYTASAWPARTSVTADTTRTVLWIGPTAPTIGGAGAVDGIDVWMRTPS